MSKLLFMDPKRITIPIEEAVSQASKFESMGDRSRAEVWYRIAGGIALYRGDLEGVRKFFQKASTFAGDSRMEYKTITARPEDAVNIARKYYENL